jgi:hypothetical protein
MESYIRPVKAGFYEIVDDDDVAVGHIVRYHSAWIGYDDGNGALPGSPFRTLASAKAHARSYYQQRERCESCAIMMRSDRMPHGLCPACAVTLQRSVA